MAILLTSEHEQDYILDIALLKAEVADAYDSAAKELAKHTALSRAVQKLLSQLAVDETAHVFVDEFADAYARELRSSTTCPSPESGSPATA